MDATVSAKTSNDDVVKVFSFLHLALVAFFFSFHCNQEES